MRIKNNTTSKSYFFKQVIKNTHVFSILYILIITSHYSALLKRNSNTNRSFSRHQVNVSNKMRRINYRGSIALESGNWHIIVCLQSSTKQSSLLSQSSSHMIAKFTMKFKVIFYWCPLITDRSKLLFLAYRNRGLLMPDLRAILFLFIASITQ